MAVKRDIDFSKIFSPYKLDMFGKCPRQYHFYYVDEVYAPMRNKLSREPGNIHPFNTLGSAVHDAITLFYDLPVGERDRKALLSCLKKAWRSEAMRRKTPPLGKWGGFGSLEEEREVYGQAIEMLGNFLKIFGTDLTVRYLPTDDLNNSFADYERFITPIADNLSVSGKLDMVIAGDDGTDWVVDFKTGKSEEYDPPQLRFYKFLAESKLGLKVTRGVFGLLRHGRRQEVDLREVSLTAVKDGLLEAINNILAEKDFTACPSKLCRFCLYRNFCPEKEAVRKFVGESREDDFASDLPF